MKKFLLTKLPGCDTMIEQTQRKKEKPCQNKGN